MFLLVPYALQVKCFARESFLLREITSVSESEELPFLGRSRS
jgi:hypothetical protein